MSTALGAFVASSGQETTNFVRVDVLTRGTHADMKLSGLQLFRISFIWNA